MQRNIKYLINFSIMIVYLTVLTGCASTMPHQDQQVTHSKKMTQASENHGITKPQVAYFIGGATLGVPIGIIAGIAGTIATVFLLLSL